MISASSALCTCLALLFALLTLVDSSHRIRMDRLDSRRPLLYRWRDAGAAKVWRGMKKLVGRGGVEKGSEEERRGLLDGGDSEGHRQQQDQREANGNGNGNGDGRAGR